MNREALIFTLKFMATLLGIVAIVGAYVYMLGWGLPHPWNAIVFFISFLLAMAGWVYKMKAMDGYDYNGCGGPPPRSGKVKPPPMPERRG